MNDFSFEYTNLSAEEVKASIPDRVTPIASASSVSIGGKLLVLKLDNGDSLRLRFSPDGASVSVNGLGAAAEGVSYSALELGDILMVCYHVPNSQTIHVAVADRKSRMATVYETWLCEEGLPAREVQREIYHGYLTGSVVPTHRPAATKRLVGKAVRWTGEAGSMLNIYATFMFSSFVPGGSDQTFTAPSDYFEFNYHTYLYSRCEIEFSGETVLEVFDLHTMKLIGVRIGFDKQDKFAIRTYTAKGKVLGNFAAYGPHGSVYDEPPSFASRPADPDSPPPSPPPRKKGMRYAYRPFVMTKKMTLEEVREAAERTGAWAGAFGGPGKEKRCMPLSDILLRYPEFSLKFGDKEFFYRITGMNEMQFRHEAGAEWKTERYEAFEADDNLAFFAYAADSLVPLETYQITLDFDNGRATCLISRLNNEKYTREPTQEWLFGSIIAPGITPSGELHGFTTELVGKSFTWTYNDVMCSQHIYSAPESYSWSIFMNHIPAMMWSSPCKYVKIRDGVYMMSWIEHRSQGIQGTFLFNTKTMHDCGTCYGLNHDQTFEFNTFGAEARFAGYVDLL